MFLIKIFPGAWQLQPGHCQCEPGGQRDVHLPGQHRPSHQQGEEAAPVRRLMLIQPSSQWIHTMFNFQLVRST